MKKLFVLAFISISIFSLLSFSCKKKEYVDLFSNEETELEQTADTHVWYSFYNDNFVKINKPEQAVANPFTPWTEAVRISSANINENGSFAIVNRLGVLSFNENQISLAKDISLFSNRTAGNLVFIDDVPMFTVYKSSFFNDSIKKPEYKFDKSQHFFLVQYDIDSKICYPVINCNNLIEPPESEVIDYVWDGLNWLCNVKTISDSKIKFSYITWMPSAPLSSLSPVSATSNISVQEIEKQTFRDARQILDFSKAPDRLEALLNGVSSKVPFLVEVNTWKGGSAKTYRNKAGSTRLSELNAKGLITEDWSGVLFEDGTFYFEGCLKDRHIVRGGKPVVLRLPKLPAGFVYSDFVISGGTLYASWEERAFYRISRSGFISVDLDKTLYSEVN